MTSKPTLNDIGLVHGTDKSTRYHGYLPVYAQALEHLREETFTLIRDTVESVVLLKHAVIVRKRPDAGRTWRRTDLKDIQEAEDSWMVGEPESYRRIEGEVVGASDYVGKALAALVDEGRVDLAAPVSARVHDVVVSTGGLCLTASGEILEESLNSARNVASVDGLHRIGNGQRWYAAPALQPIDVAAEPGVEHVLLKSCWDGNYGHWLIDVVPKLRLLEQLPLRGTPRFVLARRGGAMEAVVRDTLALAGYPDPELHYLDALTRFERLIVLGTVSHHPLVKAPSAIRYLEGLGREVPAGPHRRVYVSRNLGARRRLTNESDLLPLFTARGYHMVSPETLSLVEQISMFKGAQIVAGNLGAGLANLVFSPAGVTVLALTTPRMAHDYFYDIVCHKGGHYRGLQGISTDPQPDIGSDFSVDPAMVTAGLDWAELECGDD